MRWTLVKCLAFLSLVLACQCQTQQKFSILYKAQGAAGALANLGTIDYDFNSGVANVAISDQEAYTAILKNIQQSYLFEFKFPTESRTSLKSLVKISKGTTALGFQVHGSTSQAVTAVNVVSEGKSKTAFVRIVKPDRGDFVNPTPASDFVPEFDDVEDPAADLAPEAPNADPKAKNPRQKPIQEEKKPQPWYKEYFWYIVIGGFFLYRIMNIDKTALSEQLAEAKKQAEEIQNKKAAKKDK